LGVTFRHISDDALVPSDLGECQCCERTDAPSFDYVGEIPNPSLAANPELASSEPEIHAACAKCINSGLVQKTEYELSTVSNQIGAISADNSNAIEQYHRIPNIPLMMQRQDWPTCCNEWCEFTGNPLDIAQSIGVPAIYQYWDGQPKEPHWDFELQPESLREVCLFRCLACGKLFFIWQPT
jgi:uncharacterized protein CbrC (UPF0167 family)